MYLVKSRRSYIIQRKNWDKQTKIKYCNDHRYIRDMWNVNILILF